MTTYCELQQTVKNYKRLLDRDVMYVVDKSETLIR